MYFNLLFSFLCSLVWNLINNSAEKEGRVKSYDSDTFFSEVPRANHFIMFYAPWCVHCQKLHPVWEQLADLLNDDPENQIIIGKVDCTVENEVCSKSDITGYPTLKFFKAGFLEGIKFRGTRDLPSLISFINEHSGTTLEEAKASPVTTNGLTELTENSFDDFVKKGNFFVKFYAPWCGYCQKIAPIWEEVAKFFASSSDVHIAKVDCTVHRTICNNLEIKGYPTLLWIQDGKVIEKYQGPRTDSDLKAYVNKMLGKVEEKPEEESEGSMVILNAENFEKGISQGVSFVKFFAPWCAHCKRLAPIWDELNKKIEDVSNVRLVKIDCTMESNKELCKKEEVEGFPTIFLYKNGEKISEYSGSRNLDDMYEFLSKHFTHDEL